MRNKHLVDVYQIFSIKCLKFDAFSSNSFDGPQRSPHWLRTKDQFSKYQSVRAEYNWNCVSLRIKRWLLLKPVIWISRRKYVSDILRVFPFACHTPIDRMVRRWGHPIVELSWNGLVIHPSPASTNTQIEHTFMLQHFKNKKCATLDENGFNE